MTAEISEEMDQAGIPVYFLGIGIFVQGQDFTIEQQSWVGLW